MATDDGDDVHVDPRIEAVSEALMDAHAAWLHQSDDEVTVDAEEAARISIVAIDNYVQFDPEYCRWACHADEQSSTVRLLNDFWKAHDLPVGLLEPLVALVQTTPIDLMDMIEDEDSEEVEVNDGAHD